MVVKILTPNGWTEAEQLELFSSEEEFKVREYREVIPKQCGTCRYWIQSEKYFWKGKCRLADRERRSDEIKNCLGWKPAEAWELEKRGF